MDVDVFNNEATSTNYLLDSDSQLQSGVNKTGDDVTEGGVDTLHALIGALLALLVALTFVGNSLVIAAVFRYARLRKTTNMFIVSLATADIAVAALVMPLSIVYFLLRRWIFGWILCYFWISCDVMCCTASILHLCVIALDRYVAITEPLSYKRLVSAHRARLTIAGVWLCGAIVSFVPIYSGWFADSTKFQIHRNSHRCGLFVNRFYALVSSVTSFYAPLCIMCALYIRIYKVASAQARSIEQQQAIFRTRTYTCDSRNAMLDDERSERCFTPNKSQRSVAKDRKAIKTLGSLMGLFIVCWLPFFLMYVILPFCESCELPVQAEIFITWLGYVNSLINPCIYALLNKDFRFAFRKIICCESMQQRDGVVHLEAVAVGSGNSTPNCTPRVPPAHLHKLLATSRSAPTVGNVLNK